MLDAASRVPNADEEIFAHDDLIPGNLLLNGLGHLHPVIDGGSAGYADPAQDIGPAWSIFDEPARSVFRSPVDDDEPTWQRARLIGQPRPLLRRADAAIH